ncbi:hypothetical protein MBANPS3_007229 [Mucor bainieri]
MKLSWNDLPQELLHLIFESSAITTQTLVELNHVSKNWSQAANKVLYYQVNLNKQNIDQFLYTMNELLSPCSDCVKVVRIADDVELEMGYDHDVIQGCNNITQLWVGHLHDNYYQQLQWLYEADGKLQHYEDGTVPNSFEDAKLLRDYNCAMVSMKENIVSLLLADTPYKTLHYGYTTEDFDYLANHLDQFSRLRTLVIETHAPKYLYENDHLIQKCSPTLNSLSIAAYNAQMLPRPVSRPSLDLDSVQKRPLVETLVSYADVLTTTDMDYIMWTYPNIKHFRCQCRTLERPFHWEDFSEQGEYSIETCARFIDFAAQVRDLELFNFSLPPSALEQALLSIAKCPEVKALSISGGPLFDAEHASLNLVSAQDSFLMRDIKAPYERLLEIFRGDTIEHLTLNMDIFAPGFTHTVIGISHMRALGNSLGQALDSFPRLKEIYLKNIIIEHFSSESESRHHLKTLSMEATGVDDMTLLKLSKRISKVDHFILHEIDLLDGSPVRDDEARWVILRFPETAFDTVEFLDAFASGTGCLVRVTFGSNEKSEDSLCYLINEDSMQKITAAECDDLFVETDMYRVDLNCASIKRFGVHSYQMDSQPLFIHFDQ